MTDAQILGLIFIAGPVFVASTILISRRRTASLVERGVRTSGVVIDTRYRGGGEGGGSWYSEVRFTDGEGVERTRWLGGRYEGDVEIVHHPKRWKRAVIVEGEAVKPQPLWVRRAAIGFLLALFGSAFVAGILLATSVWSPRVGTPPLAAVCAGTGSSQHPPYGEGDGPSGVVAFDMLDGDVVDIGLRQTLEWNSRNRPWDAELVLCMERALTTFVSTCEYRGRAGNPDRSLRLFDTTYQVTLREVHTAEVLDTGLQRAVIHRQCPPFVTFAESDPNPKPSYATNLASIEPYLRPFAE